MEFAIVSSLVFVLLFWTFQIGWQLFEMQSGQSVAQQVARYAATGIATQTGFVHDAVCLAEPKGASVTTGGRLTKVGVHFGLGTDGTGTPTATDGYVTVTLTYQSLIAGALPVPSLLTNPDGTFDRVAVARLDQIPTDTTILAGFEATISSDTTC